ncbi:MAG: hypothetical protein KGI54_17550 [Pseudomonadota bacterium]|nr:hypothetical protein [Pseudomonadota bacterium]
MSALIMMRVVKGALIPADNYSAEQLRQSKLSVGEIVGTKISKCRNPGFHRLVHRFGKLVRKNIEGFELLDNHLTLKRLQLEGNIGCEELKIIISGLGEVTQRIPKSIAFDLMDEMEFHDLMLGFCRFVSDRYWQNLTEHQILEMAEGMIDE